MPNHPKRGMYAGGQRGSIKEFVFAYKLPIDIYGENVMLQWKYTTANSVSLAYPFLFYVLVQILQTQSSSHLHIYFPVFLSWICCIFCHKFGPTQLISE